MVGTSAAEAELGGLYFNGQEGIPLRTTLVVLGHHQPKTVTPLETDNTTAASIVHNNVRQHKSHAMDMRIYWICDSVKQGHYNVYWQPGKFNKMDYVKKNHPPSEHTKK